MLSTIKGGFQYQRLKGSPVDYNSINPNNTLDSWDDQYYPAQFLCRDKSTNSSDCDGVMSLRFLSSILDRLSWLLASCCSTSRNCAMDVMQWDQSYVCEFLLWDELDIFLNLDNKIDVPVHLIPQQTFKTTFNILNYCPFNLRPGASLKV